MIKPLTLTSLNIWIMFMVYGPICISAQNETEWSRARRYHCSVFSGLILSSYQKCCQGLQFHTVVHISLYDIRLLRDDGKKAATVTVRDEGHALVQEYHFYGCHKDSYRFYLHCIYSLPTTLKWTRKSFNCSQPYY